MLQSAPVNPSYHQFASPPGVSPAPGHAVNIGVVWVYFGGSLPPSPGGGWGRRDWGGCMGGLSGAPLFLSRHEHQQSHGTSLQGSVPPPRATPQKPTQCHWGPPQTPTLIGGAQDLFFLPPPQSCPWRGAGLGNRIWGAPGKGRGGLGGLFLSRAVV